MENSEIHRCPICLEPFKPDDFCATDITEGTCHAGCLEGSPVVDLNTGDELPAGKIGTYPYSDVMEPGSPSIHPQKWTRWQGGKMPVPEGASVEVILRYGKQALAEAGSGYAARWSYDSRHGDHDDIVFYRLCTPTPETIVGGSEIADDLRKFFAQTLDWADENGWTDAACQNDRIVDWFGPSDFLGMREITERLEALTAEEASIGLPSKELEQIDAILSEGQGDDEGSQILPDFPVDCSVHGKVEACLHLLERRRDVIEGFGADDGFGDAAKIGDAVLSWLVKHDLADAENEYDAADVIEILNDLAPKPTPIQEAQQNG
ncbi:MULTISPECIES: hypothetical protein [unclassified Rhizobium]